MTFGFIDIQKCKKISANNFLCLFLSFHYGFTKCFHIYIYIYIYIYIFFFFSLIYQKKFQLVKYYHSNLSTQLNSRLRIQLFSLFGWFFKNFPPKTYCILKMFLLSAQNNIYVIMSSYVKGHAQKYLSLNFMSLVGFEASKICMFLWKIYCRIGFEIIFRQN